MTPSSGPRVLLAYLVSCGCVLHAGGPAGSRRCPRRRQVCGYHDLNDLVGRNLCSADVLVSLRLLSFYSAFLLFIFLANLLLSKTSEESFSPAEPTVGRPGTHEDALVAISIPAEEWKVSHKHSSLLLDFLCLPGWVVVQELDAHRDQRYFWK